eukprot:TRINITY_DN1099_c0_g1_i1.p1 TRINITY_DN1099_c0_g1~~TRINITY_DN1099_c0_g1_i1.p1  ORF type:complete len:545 (-),score=92.95 TRINITY_DN1099_c0_g1_i1:116-1750(-)
MGGAPSYRSHLVGLPPCDQPGSGSESLPGTGGEKFFGLVNVANTCYANSVIQALYFCAPFRRCVLRHLNEDEGSDESLLTSLAELFAQIESQKRAVGCLTPRRFLSKLRKANDLFCTSEHQDAHEFMEFLLNDIVEHLAKKVQQQREKAREAGASPEKGADKDQQSDEEPRTWVHDIFQGHLVNQIKCRCCESVTVRRENFLDLSVDIERHTSTAACLRAFESTELLRAENKFFCDTCGCLQEAEKRLRVYQLPSVLTLHLKRFKYVERLGRCCRLPYRVVFPLQLQVVEHQPPARGARSSAQFGGSSSSTPTSAANGAGEKPPSRVFELRSVVVHIGRDLTRGHYVTVVRTGDRCVLLDDDVVRVVEPDVFRAFYGTPGDTVAHGESNNIRGGQTDWYPSRSNSPPLYERSPEGTCCGYLLFYEAVDGASPANADRSVAIDIGAASQWISEDCNHTHSDSGDSDDDRRGPVQARVQAEPSADAELTQVFEQRCIPGRGALGAFGAARAPVSPTSVVSGGASASGSASASGGGSVGCAGTPGHV